MALSDYSAGEKEILRHFKAEVLAENLYPGRVYDLMVQRAFINNDQSRFANALRAAVQHMDAGHWRGNPDFERAIQKELS